MVAADQSLVQQQQLMRKAPHTDYRWNLTNEEKFPQWRMDLEKIVRHSTCRGFLGSKPPLYENYQDLAPGANTYEQFSRLEQDWDKWNELLFDIIQGSLDLNPNKVEYVNLQFAENLDGNGLWNWVLTHADHAKQSQQEKLKNQIKRLHISNNATPTEIDDILQLISLYWTKIKSFEQNPRAMISYALEKFKNNTSYGTIITTLSTLHDNSPIPLWDNYNQFREKLVENISLGYERADGEANIAMPFAGASGPPGRQKRTFSNNCDRCDVANCQGSLKCCIFGNGEPSGYGSKMYVKLIKAYVKHKGLTKAKKLGRLPE